MKILTDWVSFSSLCVASAALVLSLFVSITNSRKNFENKIDECFSHIASFIQDSAILIDLRVFTDFKELDIAEKHLIEGVTRLNVFSKTNHFKFLELASNIKPDNSDDVDKSFAYCLFKLEDKYVNFRRQHKNGDISNDDLAFIVKVNCLFREYLDVLSKYLFGLKSKFVFCRKKFYYKRLKELNEEVQKL